jgi:hypothetical protein
MEDQHTDHIYSCTFRQNLTLSYQANELVNERA